MNDYDNLDDYFRDHPDEEESYYNDMAFLAGYPDNCSPVELPEDWTV